MMKRLYVIVLLLILIPTLLSAQRRRNRYRWEFVGGAGITNFLGDLGGADQIGTHAAKDWEWVALRPALSTGFRYKNSRWVGFKGVFSFGMLRGDDKLTTETFRHNRNLNFRAPLFELSAQVEGYFTKEQQGHLYRIKNARGSKKIDLQAYGFAGVGLIAFIPQGKYKSRWINLRPLSTEGEGLSGGPKKYAPVSMSFPFGVGAKYGIDKQWSVGFEMGLRYTLTDYIDDVHGFYFDNAVIKKEKGDVAAYMADPQLGEIPSQSLTGEVRGHKYKDAFIFAMFNINYKIKNYKRTRSKF